MAARIRNPSSRARAAAEPSPEAPNPAPRKPPARKRSTATAAKAKKPTAKSRSKGKARAATRSKAAPPVEQEVEQAMDDDDDDREGEEEEEAEPDTTLCWFLFRAPLVARAIADLLDALCVDCICLGFDTGEQPMMECEHCGNWFHFSCIGVTQEVAATIEAYCCEICEGMGSPPTRYQIAAPAPKQSRRNAAEPVPGPNDDFDEKLSPPSSASEGGISDEDGLEDYDSDEYEEDEGGKKKRSKRGEGGRERSRRKVEEGAEEDEEYVGDAESALKGKGKARASATSSKAPNRQRRQSSIIEDSPPPSRPRPAARKPSGPSTESPPIQTTSVPKSDKTRTHCTNTLTTLFKSVFSTSEAATATSTTDDDRASSFADAVEVVLFDGFGEADAKGVKGPRTKYAAKFRSLHFNLKSNAMFRSRISSNDLSPTQIVYMTNEDLLTPELKAMAESVRAASLRDSIKEVLAAPTAKRTHKGEEAIETSLATSAVAEETRENELVEMEKKVVDNARERDRERSASISQAHGSPDGSAGSPRAESSFPFATSPGPSASAQSPPIHSPPASLPQPLPYATNSTAPRSRPSLPMDVSITAEDLGLDLDDSSNMAFSSAHNPSNSPPQMSPRAPSHDLAGSPPPQSGPMLPPTNRSRSSFDIGSIWGSSKASAKPTPPVVVASKEVVLDAVGPAKGAEVEKTEEDGKNAEDDYDPFAVIQDDDNTDDIEALLLSGAPIVPKKSALSKSATKSTTPPIEPPPPTIVPLSELAPIWAGDVIVPEEGGFPAFGVQVGGRSFGVTPEIWNQLLPRSLTMEGRISTAVATKYLVECSFAQTRELVIVGLLPDLTGPSAYFAQKPTRESCLAKHGHVVEFYVRKDRIGVISPPEALRKIVKDIYIIPLKKNAPLPEYIELLDVNHIPETGHRDQDILMCVLVIQKGSLANVVKPSPLPTLASSVAPPSTPLPLPPPASLASAPYPLPSSTAPIWPSPAPALTATNTPLEPLHSASTSSLSALLANPSLLQSILHQDSSALSNLHGNPNLPTALSNTPGPTADFLNSWAGANSRGASGSGGETPPRPGMGMGMGMGAGMGMNYPHRPEQNRNPVYQDGYNRGRDTGGSMSPPPSHPGGGGGGGGGAFVHPSRMALVGGNNSPPRSGYGGGGGYRAMEQDRGGRGGYGGRGGRGGGGGGWQGQDGRGQRGGHGGQRGGGERGDWNRYRGGEGDGGNSGRGGYNGGGGGRGGRGGY